MRVCPVKDPIEVAPEPGRRVLCWLHGPFDQLPEAGEEKIERERIAVSDEA
jgi:hypothetical protein